MFPASVPFVVTVGGTLAYRIEGKEENEFFESVCQSNLGSSITSGGGFSGIFETPLYQKAAVNAYENEMKAR